MQKKMIFDISGSSKFESVISSLDIKTIVQCEYFAIALHTSHINHFLMKLRFYIRICYSSLVHVRLRHYMSLHVSWTWHVTVHMFSSMWGMSGMHDYYISEFKSCFGSTVSSQYNLNKHWTLDHMRTDILCPSHHQSRGIRQLVAALLAAAGQVADVTALHAPLGEGGLLALVTGSCAGSGPPPRLCGLMLPLLLLFLFLF